MNRITNDTFALGELCHHGPEDIVLSSLKFVGTFVIAHRLSTVRNAQRIVVLTNSGIDEQGTHEELIAVDGAYASVYNMQLKL